MKTILIAGSAGRLLAHLASGFVIGPPPGQTPLDNIRRFDPESLNSALDADSEVIDLNRCGYWDTHGRYTPPSVPICAISPDDDSISIEKWVPKAMLPSPRNSRGSVQSYVTHNISKILAANGVTEIHIEYDGYADEGNMGDIRINNSAADMKPDECARILALPANGGDAVGVNLSLDTSIEDVLLDAAYEILALFQSGWENNDGAFGTVSIFLSPIAGIPTASIEHNARFTDYDTYTHTL